MISVKNLNKRFGKTVAVKNFDLHVKKNAIHGLIGPEASGKSTVLGILSTLIRPDSGEVTINDIPLAKGSRIRKLVGFVPKTPQLPLDFTARRLVSFSASLHGLQDRNMIQTTLKQTGLDAVADQSLDRFSQAMIKNVATAIALVHSPQVLLLDEPMAGIDPVSQKRLRELLLSYGRTVLITGQDLDTIDGLCSSITVLRSGSVMVDDELASLRQRAGKGALEIKLVDVGQTQKMLLELQKHGARASVNGESVYVQFSSESEIPNIIRTAACSADIMYARSVKLSIEDVFSRFNAENR